MVLGPRVGGAHVDVNLKFDDKSVGQVGKQIHRQLAKLGNQLSQIGERNRRVYQEIGKDSVTAWRALMGTILAGAPLVGSAISGVAAGATALAGAFYSAGQASFSFGPLLAAIGVAAGTAFLGMRSFFKALKDGDLSGLTPSARAAAEAVQGLGDAWDKVHDTVQENIFRGLSDDIARLETTLLPALQRGLGKMGTALNGLAQDMLDYVNSAAGLRVINRFLDNSADIFARFAESVVPFLDGFLRLMNALAPSSRRLADRITDIAERFQDWTKAEGFGQRIDAMMRRAEKTAGLLFKVLGNLGSAFANVFNAANPATNRFLEMLVGLTQRFEDWTESVGGQETIAKWAQDGVDVMAQFGRTLGAAFEVIAELADPRVIISFLTTLEGAFENLGKLPLDTLVEGFVTIAEALQPISSLFLAVIIASASLNVLFGALIGQLGGVASALGKIVSPLGRAFKPLESAGKHGKTVSGLAAAFGRFAKFAGPVLSILGRFARFIPFAGWAVTFGMVVKRSQKVRDKLKELWEVVKDFGKSFGDAFKDIKDALAPLAPAARDVGKAFKWILDKMDPFFELIASNAISSLIHVFKGLAKVVRGVGKVIAGVIEFFIGLFTLDPGKALSGFKKFGDGVLKIFLGLGEVILAPVLAAFETVGGAIVDGVMAGLRGIGNAIKDFGTWIIDGVKSVLGISSPSTVFMQIGVWLIKGLIKGVTSMAALALKGFITLTSLIVGFMGRLPGRLLRLGGRAVVFLGRAFIQNAPKVLQAAGRIFTGVVRWIARLPGRLLTLGAQAIVRLGSAVVRNTPRVLSAAGRIFKGVVDWIAKLPGRLLTLGVQAVTKLGSAIRSGIGNLRTIAGNIVTAVVEIIKKLPGKLLELGSDLLSAGKKLGGKILEGIRDGISAIGDMAGSVAASLKTGINNAIGLPKHLEFKVLGKSIGFTIPGFEKGGLTPGGAILVGEGGPEIISAPRNSRVHTAAETQKMMGGFPRTVILRVGDRDFVGYIEELADDRITAADNLAWQGA